LITVLHKFSLFLKEMNAEIQNKPEGKDGQEHHKTLNAQQT
jgi:hypothetical protein